jgi:hypothetical protein
MPTTLPATNHRPNPRVRGGNDNARGTARGQSLATQGRQGRQLPPRSYTPRPGNATAHTRLTQMQVEAPCTYDTMVVDYEERIICALNQAPTGAVKCNVCATTHTFYQCPSLTGMDEEAQKMYFRMRALEKRNAKKTQ